MQSELSHSYTHALIHAYNHTLIYIRFLVQSYISLSRMPRCPGFSLACNCLARWVRYPLCSRHEAFASCCLILQLMGLVLVSVAEALLLQTIVGREGGMIGVVVQHEYKPLDRSASSRLVESERCIPTSLGKLSVSAGRGAPFSEH